MLADICIILGICIAAFHGHEIGLARQVLSAGGFLGGLFIGAFMQPYVVNNTHDTPTRALVALSITLVSALFFLSVGEFAGAKLKRRLRPIFHLDKADTLIGSLAGGASLLIVVWLLTPSMVNLPAPRFTQLLQESRVISFLEEELPPAPQVIANLNRLINPNGFPDVFAGLDRQPLDDGTPLPDLGSGALQAAVTKARPSIVKLEGKGCGGIVDGSGYVAHEGIVVTNAHVIAGVDKPTVLDSNGRHPARPIWFDSDLDMAVLRVDGLAGDALASGPGRLERGTATAVLGYPGGGSFRASASTVLDQFVATGHDIYGEKRTNRNIYELKADIIPGNSGGPLINADGTVVGLIFAESTTYEQIGYALSMGPVNDGLQKAIASNTTVTTGVCAE